MAFNVYLTPFIHSEPVALLVYNIMKIKLNDFYDDEKEVADILISVFADGISNSEIAYAKCDGWVNNENTERSVFFEAAKRIAIKKTEEEMLLALDVVYSGMKILNMNEKTKALTKLIS